jgi:cytochrome b561
LLLRGYDQTLQVHLLRNSATSYGSVAKWLHWLTAAFVVTAYLIIESFHWIFGGEEPMRSPLISYHKAVGFSVLFLMVLRVIWRVTNPPPVLPKRMPAWQVRLSRISHFLLYVFLVAMPISGYVGNSVGIDYGIFQVTACNDTQIGQWILTALGVRYEQWEIPFDTFHYQISGPFIVWVLVLVHVTAAVYHHAVLKDEVLTRMPPGKR